MNFDTEALKSTLGHASEVYDDYSSTWNVIERKSQGTIAIVGIFVGASSLVFRSFDAPTQLVTLIFSVTIFFLALSAIISLIALFVSEIEGIPEILTIKKNAVNVKSQDEYNLFLGYSIDEWNKSCNALHEANNKKSSALGCAQRVLLLGIISSTIFVMFGVSW